MRKYWCDLRHLGNNYDVTQHWDVDRKLRIGLQNTQRRRSLCIKCVSSYDNYAIILHTGRHCQIWNISPTLNPQQVFLKKSTVLWWDRIVPAPYCPAYVSETDPEASQWGTRLWSATTARSVAQIPQRASVRQSYFPQCTTLFVHVSPTKWCIVGYLFEALWDVWDGSAGLTRVYDEKVWSRWHGQLLRNLIIGPRSEKQTTDKLV